MTVNETYFCTAKGIMKWTDSSQTLTTVVETGEYTSCRGNQIGNEFYYMITEYIKETLEGEIIYSKSRSIDQSSVSGEIYKLGKLFDDKIIIQIFKWHRLLQKVYC